MPVSDSDIRNLIPQETIKRFSVGDSLYIVMEPARKGGGKSFYGYIYFPPGWKSRWHPHDPARWGGPKYQQNSPKAGHSRVLCLFLCLPAIVRDLKSSRAFPFAGWTGPHQRHSLCCGICDTIWEILPMLCHAFPFRAKWTSTLFVLKS